MGKQQNIGKRDNLGDGACKIIEKRGRSLNHIEHQNVHWSAEGANLLYIDSCYDD